MIARFKQPPLIDLGELTAAGSRRVALSRSSLGARYTGLFAGVLGFLCFMPYPAYPIGNVSAIQIGNVLVVLGFLPMLGLSWRSKNFVLFPLIVAPLTFAMLRTTIWGDGEVGVCLKAMLACSLALLTIVTVQLYAPSQALHLMTGIALATIAHAAVGLWQYISFGWHEFPMPWLYENQSFLSVQENVMKIAMWEQRPFGMFPEPSAMAASLAPWVLLWFAHRFALVRFHAEPAPWQRALFTTAAASGLGLIILSRSGHTFVTLGAVLLMAGVWSARARSTTRSFLALLAGMGLALPAVLWFASVSMSNRLGSTEMGNSSWEERMSSLFLGFGAFADGGLWDIVFGMGPGRSSQALQSSTNVQAVFSILLTYVYETGLIGLIVVCIIGQRLARLWRSLRYDLVFACVMFVWLVGVTLTTSYLQLLPLWVAFGWLTVWPQVCRPVTPDALAIDRRASRGPARWSRPTNGYVKDEEAPRAEAQAVGRRSHWARF